MTKTSNIFQSKVAPSSRLGGGCKAIALTPAATRDDNLVFAALMGVFAGYHKPVVNGIRVGVLKGNFRRNAQPVQEILVSATARMKEASFALIDSNGKSEEDMAKLSCGGHSKGRHN